MNNLGAYIQHRWYNPTMPRQTAQDVMPYAAQLYGLGEVAPAGACAPMFPDGRMPTRLADSTMLSIGSGIDVWASVVGMARPQVYRFKVTFRPVTVGALRWMTARQLSRARKRWTTLCATWANPTYVIPVTGYDIDEDGCSTRVGDRERCMARERGAAAGLGSLFGSTIGEASEWMDFVKIGVFVVGGLTAGYLAGFLWRELGTAENPRRRNAFTKPRSKRSWQAWAAIQCDRQAKQCKDDPKLARLARILRDRAAKHRALVGTAQDSRIENSRRRNRKRNRGRGRQRNGIGVNVTLEFDKNTREWCVMLRSNEQSSWQCIARRPTYRAAESFAEEYISAVVAAGLDRDGWY